MPLELRFDIPFGVSPKVLISCFEVANEILFLPCFNRVDGSRFLIQYIQDKSFHYPFIWLKRAALGGGLLVLITCGVKHIHSQVFFHKKIGLDF